MMVAALYQYYAEQDVLPTHAAFGSDAELAKYADLRKNVFFRLSLPPAIFAGKRVLEFGPDTGENSLVFARWGAQLTLVEPNLDAHPYIRRYFANFALDAHLDGVVSAALLEYQPPSRKFDVIDAEGFIYTIQPTSAWIAKARDCLEVDGFFIVSYMELYGGFFELLLKAVYQRVVRDSAYAAGIDTAKQLFAPKWNSIQHTRKIESWFMDVISNPFVRKKYFIDPVELLQAAHAGGFRLYSSWPNYRDMLAMHWIKAPLGQQDELRASIAFVEQSRLSHVLGCTCFWPGLSQQLSQELSTLVAITDELIDNGSAQRCAAARACVEKIAARIEAAGDGQAPGLDAAKPIFAMIASVFELMALDRVEPLIEFCRTDATFISTWGTPAHYAVLQRTA
jgi:hypothetical protein